jgi:hypothetical protein
VRGGEIEIRPIFKAEDFGAALTLELREREERLRAEVERQAEKADGVVTAPL